MDDTLPAFLARGWEECGLLGIGARGSVLQIRRKGHGSGHSSKQYALKRSTAEEVKALRALSHCRNVVCVEENCMLQGQVWVRMELCEGGTVRDHLRSLSREGLTLPEHQARFFIGEVLKGLDEIHRRRWMHRDIKAENIGLTAPLRHDGRVKLLDFDTAVAIPLRGRLTEVVGTAENMAPEVFEGSYDERADCWSVGILTHELLFGYRPFNDASLDGVEEMIRNWREYLIWPSGISDVTADFLKGLLAGREDRRTSAEAARHEWLNEKKSRSLVSPPARPRPPTWSASTNAARSPLIARDKVASPKPSSQFSPPGRPAWGGGGAGCSPGRRRDLHDRDRTSLGTDVSKSVTASSASGLDDSETVDRLIRMRRSLSEWGQNFGWSSPRNAERSDQSQPSQGKVEPEKAETEVPHPVVALTRQRSASPQEKEPPSSRASRNLPDDTQHSAFLEKTRARTQEILRTAMMATSASTKGRQPTQARNSERSSPQSRGSPQSDARRTTSQGGLPQTTGGQTRSVLAREEDASAYLQKMKVKQQDLLRRMSLEVEKSTPPTSGASLPGASVEDTKEIVPKETVPSPNWSTSKASSYIARSPMRPMKSDLASSANGVTNGTKLDIRVTEERQILEPISPRSYLLMQRCRTDQLLEGMRQAAASHAAGAAPASTGSPAVSC